MAASRTSQGDIVVVVKLIDRLDLSTNVEFLGDVVQVFDSGMVHIATENVLSLLRPGVKKANRVSKTHPSNEPLAPPFPNAHWMQQE